MSVDSMLKMQPTNESVDAINDCFRCGYDLRGITDDQPCPECGLLAVRSRRLTDELHDTRPTWLRHLALGLWTLLAAILIAFTWPAIALILEGWISSSYKSVLPPLIASTFEAVPLIGFDLAAVVLIVAVLLLTTPEHYAP